MYGDFVVDTKKMRELADLYVAEMQLADQLREEILRAEHLSGEGGERYRKLEKEVRDLSLYFSRMSAATKDISGNVENTSHKIREEFEENVYGK